jgi:hypothetical protein
MIAILVVITVPALAIPAPEQPDAAFTPNDPFVTCIQKMVPMFPKEGTPTTEQLRACFPGAHPQAGRDLVAQATKDNVDSAIQTRGLTDSITVIGKLIGLDQNGMRTTLHDESYGSKTLQMQNPTSAITPWILLTSQASMKMVESHGHLDSLAMVTISKVTISTTVESFSSPWLSTSTLLQPLLQNRSRM